MESFVMWLTSRWVRRLVKKLNAKDLSGYWSKLLEMSILHYLAHCLDGNKDTKAMGVISLSGFIFF
jgi:hypothetical protein